MRHILLIHFVAILALAACSKSAPTAPTPSEPPAQAAAPGASEAPKVADKAGEKPASAATGTPASEKTPAKADESDMVPKAERKPEVTKEECDKACAHATKLSMASMPPDATIEMKAAIEKALSESCPKDCMAKGTKALVECIMGAKSGMELAADCQK